MIYKLALKKDWQAIEDLKVDFRYEPNLMSAHLFDFIKEPSFQTSLRKYWGDDIYSLLDNYNNNTYAKCVNRDMINSYRSNARQVGNNFPHLLETFPYLFEIDSALPDKFVLMDSSFELRDIAPQLKGKYTVIYFWGSWCGPCINISKNIIPRVRQLIKGSDSIQLVTISSENEVLKEDWLNDIKETKQGLLNFTSFGATKKGWSGYGTALPLQDLNIFMVPNFFLIDPHGRIMLRNDIDGKCIENELKNLSSGNRAVSLPDVEDKTD